jgi:hypothetical protein
MGHDHQEPTRKRGRPELSGEGVVRPHNLGLDAQPLTLTLLGSAIALSSLFDSSELKPQSVKS